MEMVLGFQSKQDLREALFCLSMAQKKNDKGFQGLSLLIEARAAIKNHFQYHLLGREGSSCKKAVN